MGGGGDGGGGLAPIVNADGDSCSPGSGCGPLYNLCNPNHPILLDLEVIGIQNSPKYFGDYNNPDNPLVVFTGGEQFSPLDNPIFRAIALGDSQVIPEKRLT